MPDVTEVFLSPDSSQEGAGPGFSDRGRNTMCFDPRARGVGRRGPGLEAP